MSNKSTTNKSNKSKSIEKNGKKSKLKNKDFLVGAASGVAITGLATGILKGISVLTGSFYKNKNLQLDIAKSDIESNIKNYKKTDGIPKIIHQIWLGPREPPMEWISQTIEFCKNNGWKHMFYRDNDIEKFGLKNKEAYDNTKIWQEKADIARYEILYKYGGLYIDTDIIPIRSDLYKLLEMSNSTFIGVQEALSGDLLEKLGKPYISNGVLACVHEHTIMKNIIEELTKRKDSTRGVLYRTGPMLLNSVINIPIKIIPSYWAFPFGHHIFAAPKNTNIEDLKKISIFYSSSNAKNDTLSETLTRITKF